MVDCGYCGASLPLSSLFTHWKRIHSGRLPALWACEECPFKALAFPNALLHALLHGHATPSLKRGSKSEKQCVLDLLSNAAIVLDNNSSSLVSFSRKPGSSPTSQSSSKDNSTERNSIKERISLCSDPPQSYIKTLEAEEAEEEEIADSHKSLQFLANDHLSFDDGPETAKLTSISEQRNEDTVEGSKLPFPVHKTVKMEQPADLNPKTASQPKRIEHAVEGSEGIEYVDDREEAEEKESRRPCHYCGAQLSGRIQIPSKAAEHVAACLQIRPFECSVCGHLFSRKTQFLQHVNSKTCTCKLFGAVCRIPDK